MPERRPRVSAPLLVLVLTALAGLIGSCSVTPEDRVTPVSIPATSLDYIVLAWNDVGMHGFNATYDNEVLRPPYNTLMAQVVKRGKVRRAKLYYLRDKTGRKARIREARRK